jgi:hypothetical protein
VAGVLALLSSAVPAIFAMVVLVLGSSGDPHGAAEWLPVILPLLLTGGLACALFAGGVLLLMGRSWLAAALPAGVVTVLVLWGRIGGSLGGSSGGFGLFSVVVPAATAVLASLPVVRRWVAGRRSSVRPTS